MSIPTVLTQTCNLVIPPLCAEAKSQEYSVRVFPLILQIWRMGTFSGQTLRTKQLRKSSTRRLAVLGMIVMQRPRKIAAGMLPRE